jgi:hypothetical protein
MVVDRRRRRAQRASLTAAKLRKEEAPTRSAALFAELAHEIDGRRAAERRL